MPIHEVGDEALRPTNAAWKCSKCGATLLTVSCIESHKARCTNNPNVKPTVQKRKSEDDILREQQLQDSLATFKKEHGM